MEKEAVVFGPNLAVCRPSSAFAVRVMPLSMVRDGEKARVQYITGKDETRHFLGSIGFVKGAEVSVVTAMNGNIIVNIKGTRVAISKSMASLVLTV